MILGRFMQKNAKFLEQEKQLKIIRTFLNINLNLNVMLIPMQKPFLISSTIQ